MTFSASRRCTRAPATHTETNGRFIYSKKLDKRDQRLNHTLLTKLRSGIRFCYWTTWRECDVRILTSKQRGEAQITSHTSVYCASNPSTYTASRLLCRAEMLLKQQSTQRLLIKRPWTQQRQVLTSVLRYDGHRHSKSGPCKNNFKNRFKAFLLFTGPLYIEPHWCQRSGSV